MEMNLRLIFEVRADFQSSTAKCELAAEYTSKVISNWIEKRPFHFTIDLLSGLCFKRTATSTELY
jgi:hypothetical protein